MAKKHVRTPRAPANNGNALLRAGVGGFLLGVLLLFLVAFLAAFAALKSNNPQSLVFPASLLATAVGGYGGALLGAKTAEKREANPFLGSFAAGGALLLFLLLISLFVPAAGASLLHRLSPLFLLTVAAALGGLTVASHRPNQKRRLKKLTSGKKR